LKCSHGNQTAKGSNPFDKFNIDGKNLSSIVDCYDPPYSSSSNVYSYIKTNISKWTEDAISQRNSM